MNTTEVINLPEGWMPYMVIYLGIVMVFGILGNTLTLLALPYVRYWYGPEFSILQTSSSILLLHLSFCDLFWCIIGFHHFIQVYMEGHFPYSANSCWWLGMLRNVVAYADFSTIAAISICVCSHRLCITCKNKGDPTSHSHHDVIFGGRRIILVCLFIWLASFLYMVPNIFEITGSFGWSGSLFGCNLTPTDGDTVLNQLNHHLGVMVNLAIILVCYGLVAWQLWMDKKMADQVELNQNIQDEFSSLTRKYMFTILILSLSYLILIVPTAFTTAFAGSHKDFDSSNKQEVIVTMWYFCVYGINFIIYVLTNKRLRDAYGRFLRDGSKWMGISSGSNLDNDNSELPMVEVDESYLVLFNNDSS